MPVSSLEDEAKSFDNIFSEKIDRAKLEQEARKYVSSYVQQLSKQSVYIKPFSNDVQKYLSLAARLVASCRGIIILQSADFQKPNGEKVKYHEVIDVQIEKPWRALQQLIALAKCLAFVVGKDEIGIEELRIIKEVVISSMPADRAKALRGMQKHSGTVNAKELSDLSEVSVKTSRRLLDELVGLKVLEKIKGSGSIAADYKISSTFRDFICKDPAEFSSTYSPETETPQGIQEDLLDVDK